MGGSMLGDIGRVFQHNKPGGRVDRHNRANRALEAQQNAMRKIQNDADAKAAAEERASQDLLERKRKRRQGTALMLEAPEPSATSKLLGG